MKNLRILFVLVFTLIPFSPGCKKYDISIDTEILNERNLSMVSHAIYGNDSIFYENNQLKTINIYKTVKESLCLNVKYRMEYSDNEIRVYKQQTGCDEDYNSFTFQDSKLLQIMNSANELQASFYYDSDRLKYFLYYESSFRGKNMPTADNIATDSVLVRYDKSGGNIIEYKWYHKYNPDNLYQLHYTSNYTFDNMKNPYQNSGYSLAVNWHGFEDILSYFNANNITSIGLHTRTYNYDENGYPIHLDIMTYGRTSFYYQSE